MSEQSQYILHRVDYTSDRLGPDEVFDISKSVVELNIFENIELPYLTANLAMSDDVAFKSTVGIRGTERLTVVLSAHKDAPQIIKKFMITGIQIEVSVNERTDVRVLTMIEEHAYLSTLKKFSKAYTGVPSKIISNILSGQLNKKMTTGLAAAPSQGKIKVNIPYWNPLEAADWVRDRMSTSNGSPYFLFSSLRNQDLELADLQSLILADPWNTEKEQRYTRTQTSHNFTVDAKDQMRKMFHVKAHRQTSIESALKLAQAGAVGADYKVMDLTSGNQLTNTFHSGKDTLNQFMDKLGPKETNALAIDNSLQIGAPNDGGLRGMDGYTTKVFSSVVASRQFYEPDQFGSPQPIAGYHDESLTSSMYKLKLKSAALRAILLNNVYTISVPGQPYLIDVNGAGVGSNIDMDYAMPTSDPRNTDKVDKQRSGKFLVYKARHQFTTGIYDVHMDIVKLTGQE